MLNTKNAYLKDVNSHFIPLTELFLIGSDQNSNICLPYHDVSSRHARIEWRDGNFMIRDLRSESGTFVNQTQILEAVLNEGDQIRIGEKFFEYTLHANRKSRYQFISKNDRWQKQLKLLPNMASCPFPVLILGPSGTGKELLAQAMHDFSSRSEKAFVSVNCSALAETLIESELFGHVKGSFTGAYQDRKGAFETARGGTLFLDEIGDLPYSLQAKLLRALENNEIRPVGSDRTIQTDVRVVAATHQNLLEKVREKSFRQDLFFRLNVITINSPSLKERTEDFEDLLFQFSKKYRVRFSHGAIQKMKTHSWSGNIRELKNVVARASALIPDRQVEDDDVDQLIHSTFEHGGIQDYAPQNSKPLSVIKEIEKEMILKRLAVNRGNQRRTAHELGMPKSTLHDRIKDYNIDTSQFKKRKTVDSTVVLK